MSPFRVIIIGSGLSGSLLGNGLAKNDIDFSVYEREPRHSKREGYQIRFGENALIGMRACLHHDHLSRVVENIGPNTKVPIIYNKLFRKILDLNQLPNYTKSAPIDRVILRDVLAEPLVQLGKLHYNKKFVEFQIINEEKSERVRVSFDDGSTDTCDLLIGADGNRSKVNELLCLNNINAVKGHTACLTKCDLPLTLYNNVEKELLASPIATLQDSKLMYFCAYLPKSYTATRETVDSAEFDKETSSCMLSLCWPTGLTPTWDAMELEQRWDAIGDIFKDWSPKHQQVLKLCRGQNMFLLSPRVGSQPAGNWRKKVASSANRAAGNPHVWLMGDAVHPMLPNRGMGGQQAMRDTADVLPLILKLAAKASTQEGLSLSDFEAACDIYEKGMMPRAFDWVRKSGGENWVPINLSKPLHRLVLGVLSKIIIPTAKIGYWILSWFTDTRGVDDAPEFEAIFK